MSIAEIVILIACLIAVILNLVRIAILVMSNRRITQELDQKTWERIEGWRK